VGLVQLLRQVLLEELCWQQLYIRAALVDEIVAEMRREKFIRCPGEEVRTYGGSYILLPSVQSAS
jgi:hypothetical protein